MSHSLSCLNMLLYLIRQDAAPGSVSSQTGLSFMVLQELQTIQRGHWVPRPDFPGSGHDRFLETTTFINDSFKHLTWDGHCVFHCFLRNLVLPLTSGLRHQASDLLTWSPQFLRYHCTCWGQKPNRHAPTVSTPTLDLASSNHHLLHFFHFEDHCP